MMRRIIHLSVATAFFALALSGYAHAAGAPELDPGNATSGLVLLIGGALFMIERYRR